jgi:hypothetical protein
MPRTCAFCPADATSYEHVLPRWIAGVLGNRGAFSPGAAVGVPNYPARIDDMKARVLCPACNQHFGDTLESPVSALLAPAMRGDQTLELCEADQRLVSCWAAKTAACLIAARPQESGIPFGQRQAIRSGTAPKHCLVALARPDIPTATLEAGRLMAEDSTAPPDPELAPWFMVLSAGHLTIFVWGVGVHTGNGPLGALPGGQFVRIWPAQDDIVRWPPLWPISDDELRTLPLIGFRGERSK